MATSDKITTSTVASGSTPNSRFYFKWDLASQNVTNNTSTINWHAGWEGTTGAPSWLSNAIRIDGGEIVVGGVAIQNIGTGTWSNQSGTGEHELKSGTATITHNADGTGSFSAWLTGWFYTKGQLTCSGSWSLTTIPRASTATLSSTSVAIGSSQTVTITRASTSFTHDLDWSVNGVSIGSQTGVATSQAFTIPADASKQITNATSGTCTVTIKTKNGSTVIGTTTLTFTITIPDNDTYKPSFTATLTRVDGSVPTAWALYVQGFSKWKIDIASAAAGSNATLKTWAVTDGTYTGGGPLSAATASYQTTDVLRTSGTVTITVSVTDSRGRTTTKTLTASVVAWSAPTITPSSPANAYRVNSSGTATFNGTYASIQASWAFASVSSKNSVTYTLEYKTTAATAWTAQSITLTSGTRAAVGGGNLAATSSYNIRLTVKDGLGVTATYTWTIGTAQVDLDFRQDKNGMGIGCVGETAGVLEIGWPVNLQQGLKTVLPVTYGGTGKNAAPSLLVNLASTTAASPYEATPRPGVTNILPKTYGGTGTDTGVVAVMNGSWYEERLGSNFYRWTQIVAITNVSCATAYGASFYATVNLPAKPTGATITQVSAQHMLGGAWMDTGLTDWNALVVANDKRTVSGKAAIVAYGTKP